MIKAIRQSFFCNEKMDEACKAIVLFPTRGYETSLPQSLHHFSYCFEMLRLLLLVGMGSALGGMLRYGVSLLLPSDIGRIPWATLLVNLLGCFLLGLFNGYVARFGPSAEMRAFLAVGLCGGFTTFSTFIAEGGAMFRAQFYPSMLLYWGASCLGGLLLLFWGNRWGEGI